MLIRSWLISGKSMVRVKVFLDTNVLLDVLEGDRPSTAYSNLVFQAVRERLLEGVLTTQSIIDASYIAAKRKDSDFNAFCRHILQLMHFMNIESLEAIDLREAFLHPTGDFEDDVQYSRAIESACDLFITSDRSFKRRSPDDSGMQVFTPEELVRKMTAIAPSSSSPAAFLTPQRGQ